MAPWLLYRDLLGGKNSRDAEGSTKACGLCVGPMPVVVMDYVDGVSMDKTRRLPDDTHK